MSTNLADEIKLLEDVIDRLGLDHERVLLRGLLRRIQNTGVAIHDTTRAWDITQELEDIWTE